MKAVLSLLARLSLAAACLLYAVWDLDLRRLLDQALRFQAWPLAAALLLGLGGYALQGLRFFYMTGPGVGYNRALQSTVLGLGLNHIFPARLGELGKALYLRRHAALLLRESLGLIFWERFADLNLILLLSVGASMLSLNFTAWLPLGGVVAGLWCCVAILLLSSRARTLFLKLLPFPSVRGYIQEVLQHLVDVSKPAFLLRLALLSGLVWAYTAAVFAFDVVQVAGIRADWGIILTVFAASSLSFVIPSSPGGLGLYEAAMVFSFGWFGVNRESALVVALLIRLTQSLPAVAATLLLLDREHLNFGSLRKAVLGLRGGTQAPPPTD